MDVTSILTRYRSWNWLYVQLSRLSLFLATIRWEWAAEWVYRLERICDRRREAEPIHMWFELTRAQYLTVPRSVLQTMPHDWQCRLVALMEELDETIDWRPNYPLRYWVRLENEESKEVVRDPLMDYRDYQTYEYIRQKLMASKDGN
jgi:hypothetical protein